MRYPLIEGQGNFGSIDGDPPAAMRYTEARLSHMAEEILSDIDKNTVDFRDNFDGSLQEPDVLPARLPNLLLNGSSGIAVGMATNIPPHNLGELGRAIQYIIDQYDRLDEISVEELLKLVPGPDFPTGGIIVGSEGILQAYSTGRGRIVLRGAAHIDEMTRDRYRIIITEIPYQINKTSLIERIAELARSGRLDDISDLRDESDRRGMRIVIELRRGAQPRKILNQLYKYTPLQSTFGVQMLALVDNEPRLLTLKRALQTYIEHRRVVIVRRSEYELNKSRERAHVLAGLLIALANLDEVIATIRQSPDADIAKERLMSRFNLSERQAQAILDIQLRRLAALERQKIEDEQKQTLERIAFLEDLLHSPAKVLQLIKTDLDEVIEKYNDERRTQIAHGASDIFNEEELVRDEAVLVSLTQRGYIKRVAAKAFRAQGRGGRGVTGHQMKEEDEVLMLIPANTLNTVLFFSNKGKVYSVKAYQIPEADRTGKGVPVVNILNLGPAETITAAVAIPDFNQSYYCVMATRRGRIKRLPLSEFESVRPSGLIAINLDDKDELGWARLTHGKDDIILITEQGQALRYSEQVVRPTGRAAAGVTAIRLDQEDAVTSMEVVESGGYLLIITTGGYGKRTPLTDYPVKGRATRGIHTIDKKAISSIGPIASARVVQIADDLTIISANGVVLRTKVQAVSQSGRAARGIRLINVGEGDSVVSLARIADADLRQVGASEE